MIDGHISDVARADREWITDLSLYEHLRIGLSHPEVREIIGSDVWIEMSCHIFCIFSRDAK